MSLHDGASIIEAENTNSSDADYKLTANTQPDITRAPGYSRSYAIKFPTSNLARKADQKASSSDDYGKCYAPNLDANSEQKKFHRDGHGVHNEILNQSAATGANSFNGATEYPQAMSLHNNIEQLSTLEKPPKVPNYLVFSIVACFFCLPIGGAALGYVIISSKQLKERKYQAAIDSASTAYKICILAIVFGVISIGVSGFLVWYQIQRLNKILSPQT